ncbi:uncharacterized protein LOC106012718 [Aplysia californica]|uniref:Uncharacterized protein LOC106012718 n=1 Tax=Aplysia californica TaxID=6500 RepID=A0ABM1A6T5_APLCA|nr:uncharacterized protein LOC106012718 [Aplysia californica]
MEMHDIPKPMPEGSNAFSRAMADFHMPPIVEVSDPDEADNRSRRSSCARDTAEEGKIVHGLHHCYKVENGQVSTSFHCHHDHHKLSNGHLNELAPTATNIGPPSSPQRRMSIATTGVNLLVPGEDEFRPRSLSDASMAARRRGSLPAGNYSPGNRSPRSSRRGSVDMNMASSPSPTSPGKKSPNTQRRGSNAALHSDELHYVYDQYLKGKK